MGNRGAHNPLNRVCFELFCAVNLVVSAFCSLLIRLFDLLIILSAKNRTPDPCHHYQRAYTTRYRAKKRVVYYFWVTSLLCMLIVPTVGFVTTAGLFTTFISFSYLDEGDEVS